jgi:NAD-dependent DNA ligase
MSNEFARQGTMHHNEFNQSLASLAGIVTGILADSHLNDAEIRFLNEWIATHDEIAHDWPGDVIHARVRAILADGIITEQERTHLAQTLQAFLGESPDSVAEAGHVTELVFDEEARIEFPGQSFCLTGNFVYAPRDVCETTIIQRGGITKSAVSRKVRYVVVGSLGSQERKHGCYGTKLDKAMELKRDGAPIVIVKEDTWAAAL